MEWWCSPASECSAQGCRAGEPVPVPKQGFSGALTLACNPTRTRSLFGMTYHSCPASRRTCSHSPLCATRGPDTAFAEITLRAALRRAILVRRGLMTRLMALPDSTSGLPVTTRIILELWGISFPCPLRRNLLSMHEGLDLSELTRTAAPPWDRLSQRGERECSWRAKQRSL